LAGAVFIKYKYFIGLSAGAVIIETLNQSIGMYQIAILTGYRIPDITG